MTGITAIHGVDDTLKTIAKNAVTSLTKVPTVTVGPLKNESDLRVNWFLYRIGPNAAYRNMEPPRTGWQTTRGKPPLALELHYLLTVFPGGGTVDGDQEQFSHAAIAAVMQALNDNAIVGEGDPLLSAQARPLVEPLRITLETLDLEALSKLWTAAAEPLRLSVGYQVSLVTVDPPAPHAAGPPVRTPRVFVGNLGPRLENVSPARATAADELTVTLAGWSPSVAFTLAAEPGDPALPPEEDAWPMTFVRNAGPDAVVLRLPRGDLAPGLRRLDASVSEGDIVLARDSIGLNVVPAVTGPAQTVARGSSVTLTTQHAASDVEVFLSGKALPPADVQFLSAQSLKITVPPSAEPGPAGISLRAAKLAGPVFDGLVVAP